MQLDRVCRVEVNFIYCAKSAGTGSFDSSSICLLPFGKPQKRRIRRENEKRTVPKPLATKKEYCQYGGTGKTVHL